MHKNMKIEIFLNSNQRALSYYTWISIHESHFLLCVYKKVVENENKAQIEPSSCLKKKQ